MLILERRIGQSLQIGKDITVYVTKIASGKVEIGIEAPLEIEIVRSEAKNKKPKNRKQKRYQT